MNKNIAIALTSGALFGVIAGAVIMIFTELTPVDGTFWLWFVIVNCIFWKLFVRIQTIEGGAGEDTAADSTA